MTVKELIDKLERVDDKSMNVCVWDTNSMNHMFPNNIIIESKESCFDSADLPWDEEYGFLRDDEKLLTIIP